MQTAPAWLLHAVPVAYEDWTLLFCAWHWVCLAGGWGWVLAAACTVCIFLPIGPFRSYITGVSCLAVVCALHHTVYCLLGTQVYLLRVCRVHLSQGWVHNHLAGFTCVRNGLTY
jgi:hypothetical protein